MDEFAYIAEIRRRLLATWPDMDGSDDVVLGIGDDAAVLADRPGLQVLSVDTVVEDVHFRRDWLTPEEIALRGIGAAASDLAAMGARPRAALISLILPATLALDVQLGLAEGIAGAARQYRMPVVGGNVARGSELSLTTTVIGDAPEQVSMRVGARPGDRLYVTGTLGSAALGLKLLERGLEADAAAAPHLARYRRPVARIHEGLALRGIASSAIDVSDGLLPDLKHMCEASVVGARLRIADLPIDNGLMALATRLGLDGVTLALTGGDDYELLFSMPPGRRLPVGAACIGLIEAEPGVRLEDANGQPFPHPEGGYRHFTPS